MESDIIKISHLNKSFGEVKAVNDLSFRVKKGELKSPMSQTWPFSRRGRRCVKRRSHCAEPKYPAPS